MVTFKGDSQTQALTSVSAKDSVYFTQKTYFFYFTLSLLQNTHISLSIIHIFLLKIIFSLNFFIISHLTLLFPLNTPPSSSHNPYLYLRLSVFSFFFFFFFCFWESFSFLFFVNTSQPPSSSLPDQRTTQDQTNPRSETHPTRNPLIKQREISESTVDNLIKLRAAVV